MRSFVQEKSYGSVKVFWLDRERLLQALEEKAAELLATFPEGSEVRFLVEGQPSPGLAHLDLEVPVRLP